MKTFLISDQHFSHYRILSFKRDNGELLRTFENSDEMDNHIIECHNKVVGKNDKVYFLGDVCFHNRILDKIMPQMNGTKVLIKGNHDLLKLSQYMKYFKDVRAYGRLDKFVLGHIPIHPDSLGYSTKAMIHGHTHYKNVTISTENGIVDDDRYFNVSVENVNYTPVDFEFIRSKYI